jgi:hypothetical protein
VDRLDLLLYASRVQGKALDLAQEARVLGSAIHEADGLVDEAMLIRRAQVIDGLVEMRRDDLRVLRHPRWIGRRLVGVALVFLGWARRLR